MTMVTEIHELLATNPAISVYKFRTFRREYGVFFESDVAREIGPPSLSSTFCGARVGLEERLRR